MNWYIYYANNPVKFVDPDGYTLRVYLERENEAINNLQKLTDDKLIVSPDGTITYEMTNNNKKPSGTLLIRTLIDSKTVTTIKVTDKKNECSNYFNKDNKEYIVVSFNPNANERVITQNNNGEINFYDTSPSYISLGHELSHAEAHLDENMAIIKNNTVTYWVKKVKMTADLSEALATGVNLDAETLRKFNKYTPIVTENDLRKEQGLPIRVIYK